MKTTAYKVKSTPPPLPLFTGGGDSPQRRRTTRLAVEFLDQHCRLSGQKRKRALDRIKVAKQPKAEARRIIEHAQRQALRMATAPAGPDLSDVQELIAKLTRRDGGLWPPQSHMIQRLSLDVLSGMNVDDFQGRAALIFSMPQAISPGLRKWCIDGEGGE